MKRLLLVTLLILTPPAFAATQSDSEIKQQIIKDSIANYPGNCPCPYNSTRNGSHCGKRSAYSRPGGASPICYEQDITAEMISNYRKSHAR